MTLLLLVANKPSCVTQARPPILITTKDGARGSGLETPFAALIVDITVNSINTHVPPLGEQFDKF